jgi:hypothetical protein
MTNSDKATIVLLAATVGLAIYRFYNMTQKEKEAFYADIKDRLGVLLKNTDDTVETVKQYFTQIDEKPSGAWADKMLIFRRMLSTLFGTDEKLLAY